MQKEEPRQIFATTTTTQKAFFKYGCVQSICIGCYVQNYLP